MWKRYQVKDTFSSEYEIALKILSSCSRLYQMKYEFVCAEEIIVFKIKPSNQECDDLNELCDIFIDCQHFISKLCFYT